MNLKLAEKELIFLKDEQKYMENKLNILGATISAANSLVFIGITNFFHLSTLNYIGVILTLLFPFGCFLLGLFPWKTFFMKKYNNDIEKKYNIFSQYKEKWNNDNILFQINYQIDISLKIIKRKNTWICWTIITEFLGVIFLFLFLFLI